MKRALFFSLMASLVLSMPSCSSDDQFDQDGKGKQPIEVSPTITVNMADLESGDATKTHLDRESCGVTWKAGDKIILISKSDFYTTAMPYGTYELQTGAGTRSATFKLVEGNHGSTEGEFYGIYCPAGCNFYGGGSTPSSWRGYMTIVATQPYVEGGVADGLLTMWGYGKSMDEIQFSHNQSVVEIPLWCSESKTIDRIELTSLNGLCGRYFHRFGTVPSSFQFESDNPVTKLTYTFGEGGLQLSTNSAEPTYARIVVPGLSLPKLAITVYDEDGSHYAYVCKTSAFSHGPGKVVTFPTTQLTFHKTPTVEIKVGDADYVLLSNYEGTPSGEVLVKADAPLISLQMEQVATILKKQKKNGTISLDLSQTSLEDANFGNWFVNCKSLYGIKLPEGLKTTSSGLCLPTTITSRIDFPEGMESINTNFLNNPVCEVGIPASLKTINIANAYTVTGFDVASGNATFASEDGVLFNKDKTKLLYYPGGRPATSYTIPSSVTSVGNYAFQANKYLESLIVPENVKSLGNGVFSQAKSFNYIELQCGSATDPTVGTDLTGITYNDSGALTSLFTLTGSDRKIKVPSGCTYYSNHKVWSQFFDKLNWTLEN